MYLQETEWFAFLPSNDFTIADNNLSTIGHYHLNKSTKHQLEISLGISCWNWACLDSSLLKELVQKMQPFQF